MNPALLLIDLQRDFLAAPSLEPAAARIVHNAEKLLNGARQRGIPVFHIWTTIRADNERMPHWKRENRHACVEGTEGHTPPPSLSPLETESVFHKIFFSAFSNPKLVETLRKAGADTVILAGVHLHACIRATALDAYQRGFEVWVAEDAVGSDDPLHAAITQRYLAARAARFISVESCLKKLSPPTATRSESESRIILPAAVVEGEVIESDVLETFTHESPRDTEAIRWRVPICSEPQINRAVESCHRAQLQWRQTSLSERAALLRRLAELLDERAATLAQSLPVEIGKPLTMARAEMARAAELVRGVSQFESQPLESPCGKFSSRRFMPHGVVAAITPWNNPIAIPLGKLAPALFYGNTVAWKPSPFSSAISVKLLVLFREAGFPSGVVNLVCGDSSTAQTLMVHPQVDAVTLTGSSQAGFCAQEICGRRRVPLQAELGGNNAAIVWSDAEVADAAAKIAEGAFGFAGQRCTANRRVIVGVQIYEDFLKSLQAAATALSCGDPTLTPTRVGPLITRRKCDEVIAEVQRAREAGNVVLLSHGRKKSGAFFPPTIVCCDNAKDEIVQEEMFAPVLVVQKAEDWRQAIELCNGVRQGLVASLFSRSEEAQRKFLEEARAGILKLNTATTDADASAPFGGWKHSGIGPPEHGESNREFYTRTQAVYRGGV